MVNAPGFFGKLPGYGDFVGRRLPPAMREPFDAWLQRALLHSQRDLGAAWQPAWLHSPLWRFALAPGVCGEQGWCGVMMPSMDRVGRCFPLVLAAPGMAALADCLGEYAPWFARLEDIALAALEPDCSVEGVDAALLALDALPAQGGPQGSPSDYAQVTTLADGALPALAGAPMRGASAWWTEGAPQVAPCLAVCPGLPPPAGFAALLDGAWPAHGWRVA